MFLAISPSSVNLGNQNLMRALEVLLVAFIWLFFLRVMRAVWVEVRPPRRGRAGADVVDLAGPPVTGNRQRGPRYRLKVLEPEAVKGHTFEVAGEVTIGRASGCGIRLEDAYTSNLHARLYRDGAQELWVEDLGSTNGTWVNAQRISGRARLGKGDLLQVGGTVFEVVK